MSPSSSARSAVAAYAASVLSVALAGCSQEIGVVAPEVPLAEGEGDGDLEGDCASFDPGPALLRRLTPLEVTRTVEQITGVALSPQARAGLPLDVALPGLLENDVSLQNMSEQFADGMGLIAEEAASGVDLSAFVGCSFRAGDGSADEDCHRQLIEAVGPLAFRRPLEAAEVDRLMALAQAAPDWSDATIVEGSGRVLVSAMLQSPQFLFRAEFKRDTEGTDAEVVPLNGYELAARLSFSLWGEGPDAELLRTAASGGLDTTAGIAAVVDSMIHDPRADAQRRELALAMFGFGDIDHLGPNADQAGDLAALVPAIREAAKEEIRLLGSEVLGPDGDARQLLRADYVNVNGPLAQAYDIDGVDPADDVFRRMPVPTSGERGGILASAAYFLLGSHAGEPSDTVRGKFVRQTLMCGPRLQPPANATEVEMMNGPGTRMTLPSCAACHRSMDPIGYGLAHYDSLGRLVDSEVRDDGYFFDENTGEEIPLAGPHALADLLLSRDEWSQCLVQRTFQWVNGHAARPEDGCALQAAHDAFVDGDFRGSALFTSVLTHDAQRFRRAAGPAPTP